jgi:hypothetical protein
VKGRKLLTGSIGVWISSEIWTAKTLSNAGQYRIKLSEHTMKLSIIHSAPVTERADIIKMAMFSIWI